MYTRGGEITTRLAKLWSYQCRKSFRHRSVAFLWYFFTPALLTCLFCCLSLLSLFVFCFTSVGVVATQFWWQEHPGWCCRQVLYWSPAHPVVGMDTAAPDLPGRLRRQTFVKPNQPGETFYLLSNIILIFVFKSSTHACLTRLSVILFPSARSSISLCMCS